MKVLTSYRDNIAKLHLNLVFKQYIFLVLSRLHMVPIGDSHFRTIFVSLKSDFDPVCTMKYNQVNLKDDSICIMV